MSLVVAGATGQLGRLVIASLLAKGVAADQIVALGRDDERLAAVASLGVTARKVDYSDAGAVADALTDASRVLLISGNEIGQRLFISPRTVQNHLTRIREKTGLRRRSELARWAVEHAIA